MTDTPKTRDELRELRARANMYEDPHFVQNHWPGDPPRKWRTPGGALFNTLEPSEKRLDQKRKQAEATMKAEEAAGLAVVPMEAMDDMSWAAGKALVAGWRGANGGAADKACLDEIVNAGSAAGNLLTKGDG